MEKHTAPQPSMYPVRVVIFTKAPRAGLAKSRLIPALGEEGAALLARRMLLKSVSEAMSAGIGCVEVSMTPFDDEIWAELPLPREVDRSDQGEGDLGLRMARAAARVIDRGESVILTGTDCPGLDAAYLKRLAGELQDKDAVMAPTADGGYAAIGLRRFEPLVFQGINWSTDSVAYETLFRLVKLGWSVGVSRMLHDIDRPCDLKWLPADWPEAAHG